MTITEEAAAAPAVSPPRGTPHLNAALAAAQAEMPKIAKDETAKVQAKPGKQSYSYSYADLASITASAYPVLGKHGLAFSSQPTLHDGKFVLRYQLLHESGEAIDGLMFLPSSGTPQELGSLITYYKRYAFCAVTGITPGGDDDDAQSSNHSQSFERYPSAGEAFENAAPVPPRRTQPARPAQPPVTVPPLDDDDPWKVKIEDIADAPEGAAVRAEVAEMLETGQIDQDRASRLNAVITAKGLALLAAQGKPRPGREPAVAPPPIRAEDQGARKPEQAAAPEDVDWVTEFSARLAEAAVDDLGAMQKEVGRAVAARKIQPDTAGELAAAIRLRRNSMHAPVPA